jgi:ubiquinone/menaquinone biosynthesis C-methylase UbiE
VHLKMFDAKPNNELFQLKIVSQKIKRKITGINLSRLMEFSIILKWIGKGHGERIGDIACGGGDLSLKLAKRGYTIYGLDLSREAIERTRIISKKNKNCKFISGDAECMPYHDAIFDNVVCNCALEHFREDLRALKEMRRVLKPSGILILTCDSFSYPNIKKGILDLHRKNAFVVNYYTYDSLKERLESIGFEISDYKYYLNSFLSSIFFIHGIKIKWYGISWLFLSFIGYPLCILSDKCFGKKDCGYGLAIKAKRTFTTCDVTGGINER